MIPRRSTPVKEPAAATPPTADNAAPIEHRAIEVDFIFPTATVPIMITDGNGTLEERGDRYIVEQDGERIEIFKRDLMLTRRRERTFYTAAPAIVAPIPAVIDAGDDASVYPTDDRRS